MKKLALFIILTAILGFNVTVAYRILTNEPTPVVTQPTIVPVTHPVASEVAQLVNAERVKYGLSPLVEDARLDASASEKCADEVKYNYNAHYNPVNNYRGLNYIHDNAPDAYLAAENLSWNYATSQGSVDGLMNSPPHREAILNGQYTHVGYAVCEGDRVVQHFVGE